MVNSFSIEKLNEEQRLALSTLKDNFKHYPDEYLHNEKYLMHWLIARKYDATKAADMLLWHYRMRKAIGMDDPKYKKFQPVPIIDQFYPHGVYRHDKEGRPIAYFPIGGIDSKGIVSNVKSSDIYRGVMYWQEQRNWNCQYASEKFNKNIQQATYILDLKGLGAKHLWKPGLDVFQEILHLVEQHTPEIMYRLIIINAPAVFPIIYKLVKPILDENTKNKIQIFGDDYKETLLEYVHAEDLPVYYGGKSCDENNDPDCRKHIFYGGLVPVDDYKNPSTAEVPENLAELRIKAGSQIVIPVDVEEGCTIEWYIKAESSYDFFFAVYINNATDANQDMDTNKMEMVVPYFRIFANLVPETGRYLAKNSGQYCFQFDNRHSWLTGKRLKYSLKIKTHDGSVKNGSTNDCCTEGQKNFEDSFELNE